MLTSTLAKQGTSNQQISEPAGDLSVVAQTEGSQVILKVKGELAYRSEGVLRSALERALANDGVEYLILDLAGVKHVTSAGMGVLLIAKDYTEQAGVFLVLANTTDYVRQIYKIAHFGRMMPKLEGNELTH